MVSVEPFPDGIMLLLLLFSIERIPNSPGVEAACYVCMVDEGNELIVWSTFKVSVSFAEINVDLDWVFDCWHGEHATFLYWRSWRSM